ncbi:hypothetical protein PLICRDRAFT_169710 [Plicaturopsis crispa FD-325 SS-3]|nr:hypothetical protein PLICRDRAFT_169710 [Plicaturopsis crispa FD-325 SS-3]
MAIHVILRPGDVEDTVVPKKPAGPKKTRRKGNPRARPTHHASLRTPAPRAGPGTRKRSAGAPSRSRARDSRTEPAAESRARLLLHQAQRTVELDTNWLGQRPAIMDVILDLISPGVELAEAIKRGQIQVCPAPMLQDYDPTDPSEALGEYWEHQAAFWDGVQPAAPEMCTRFEVSAERSTA